MGYNAVGAALKHYPHGGNKKLVLLAIAENANIETWVCWPSIKTIARCACQSERSVMRLVKELESEGILEVRRFPGKRKNNIYRVRIDRLERMPSLIKTPFDKDVEDLFDPVVGDPFSVDNPVGNGDRLSPLKVPDCHLIDDRAMSHEPLVTVRKPSNRTGGNVENPFGSVVGEHIADLADRWSMPE